jgi:hypothetical protein
VYEILQGTNQTINAVGNYWFQNSTEGVKLNIFDIDDSVSTGPVNVVPFLPYPVPVNVRGGDLDEYIFYFANDFTAFMRGALGTTPFDNEFNPFVDRNDDYVIDEVDFFLFALENNAARAIAPRQFPATPTPSPTFTPLFFPTATHTFTITNTPIVTVAPTETNTFPPGTIAPRTPTNTPTVTNTSSGPTATPTATVDTEPTDTPTTSPLVNIELCSALPNPVGNDDNNEQVTVRNLETSVQNLNGWFVQDEEGNRINLSGLIGSNQTSTFTIAGTEFMDNTGGETLTLFDSLDRQIDQATYPGNPVEGEVVSFSAACPPSGGASRLRVYPRSSTDPGFGEMNGLLRLHLNPGLCGRVQERDPQSTGIRHAIVLNGDITSTSYRYHLWMDTDSGNADFRVRLIHRQTSTSNETILGTSNFTVGSLEPVIVENPITGLNPDAVAGDLLILEVVRTSGSVSIGTYLFGDCADDGGNEPAGHSWVEFTGSVVDN